MKKWTKIALAAVAGTLAIAAGTAIWPFFETFPDDSKLLDAPINLADGLGTRKLVEWQKNYESANKKDVPAKQEIIAFFRENVPAEQFEETEKFSLNDIDYIIFGIMQDCVAQKFPREKNLELADKILALPEYQNLLEIIDNETDFSVSWESRMKCEKFIGNLAILHQAEWLKIRQEIARGNAIAARERLSRTENFFAGIAENPTADFVDALVGDVYRKMFLNSACEEFFLGPTPPDAETLAILKKLSREIAFPRGNLRQIVKNEYRFYRDLLAGIPDLPDFGRERILKRSAKECLAILADLEAGIPLENCGKNWRKSQENFWRKWNLKTLILNAQGFDILKFNFGAMLKSPPYWQMIDEARVKIACHHWRLAHGAFPQNLGMLVPEFLENVPANFKIFANSRAILTETPEQIANCDPADAVESGYGFYLLEPNF